MESKLMLLEVNALPFEKEYDGGTQKVSIGPWVLIEGDSGYILTNDECIHFVKKYGDAEAIKLPLHWTGKDGSFSMMPHAELPVTFDELKTAAVGEIGNVREWIHYWGIKTRIGANYSILKESCKDIGADIDWPDWNE
jgi:hypothetical protein